MASYNTRLIVGGIFLFALVLRVWGVANAPLGLYVDEAALGYNSYSLLLTGRDEYAHAWPIFLRSFGTYTSALAVYFLTVPIALFGLSVVSVRLTAAVWGSLTVVAVYILARKLFKSKPPTIAVMSAIVLALSPTHVLFSRAFYESTLAVLLVTLALSAKLSHRPILSALMLSLSAYAYHPMRLVAGLIMVWRFNWTAMIVFGVTQIPLWYLSFLPGPNMRFTNLTWLSTVPVKGWVREYLSQYISYFNPRNLFWLGDPDPQRSVPNLSMFYFWQVIPWGLGMVYLARNYRRYFLLGWLLLVSPVAVALTHDPFSTLRVSILLVPTALVIGLGLCQRGWWKWLGVIISVVFLWRGMMIYLPQTRAVVWNYGYNHLFEYLVNQPLPSLVVVDKPVYILYLFYQSVDPKTVQALGAKQITDYYRDTSWQNYYHDPKVRFDPLVWEDDVTRPQIIAGNGLLINAGQAKEHFFSKEFEFIYRDQVLTAAYATHPDQKLESRKRDSEPGLRN